MSAKNDPKTIRAWAFYDWANSVYPLVITTAIFPIFFNSMAVHYTVNSADHEVSMVRFFGFELVNTALYSYVLSLSFLVVSIMSPLLSGIADFTGSKKKFLRAFCYLGATSCGLLATFSASRLELSMLFVFTASIGYWGSIVFYNAYLPEISDPEHHDKVSARGFAMGYFGSSLLLMLILAIILLVDKSLTRYMFVLVALWWIGFAQLALRRLPDHGLRRDSDKSAILSGFAELRGVWLKLRTLPNLKRYLRSFFVYSMGVQTIMLMAILFAKKEIDWGTDGDSPLIISVLIIQFIGIAGALLVARLSRWLGNIAVLSATLVLWVLVCLAAYFITKPIEFYTLAVFVGLVMGGIQSLSRSTYSKLLPETNDHASFFSFYDVVEKLGIVVGTFLFGFIEDVTQSMRLSALALMVFFIVGLILIRRVKGNDAMQASA